MQKDMWGLRSKYTTLASNLEKGNPGFTAHNGNGFSWAYMRQYNSAMSKADDIKNQLILILKDGKPLALPPLPTFNISPPSSGGTFAKDFMDSMNGILSKYGIASEGDVDKLTPEQKSAFDAEVAAAKSDLEKGLSDYAKSTNKQTLTIVGNVVGAVFGVPGAGSIIAGVVGGGGVGAIVGLVGSLVDQFAVPDSFFDDSSGTLKLTDSERIKIIDELHLRMSELYQQTVAMGTNMSNEAKERYRELSQPRNDVILYGPKK